MRRRMKLSQAGMSSVYNSRNSSGVAGDAVSVRRIACRLTTSSKIFLTARPFPNRSVRASYIRLNRLATASPANGLRL